MPSFPRPIALPRFPAAVYNRGLICSAAAEGGGARRPGRPARLVPQGSAHGQDAARSPGGLSMTQPTGLPDTLRVKLTTLTRRIRLVRATRGLCLLTLTVLVLLGVLFFADTLLTLPRAVLRWALLGSAGLTALVAVCGLLLPLLRRHDPEALAALIEERYPELGERLTTTVELAGNRDAWHGSRALIELLIDDTEHRAHPLDVTRAFPARSTLWLALGTLAALLLAAAPAFFQGDR